MSGRKAWILALALSLAALPAAGVQVVDPASARRAIIEPAVVAAYAAIARDRDADTLAARLDLIAGDGRLSGVAREWLLDRGLHRLATLEPTAAARAGVIRLSRRRPVIFTRVEPEHGALATPLYDIGATARFVLRHWQRSAARAATNADLFAARVSAIDRFAARAGFPRNDPVRAGIADAYAAAGVEALAGQRAAAVAAIADGRRVDELALLIAERLADAALMQLVIGHADPSVALAAIDAVGRRFDSSTALELLAVASRRAETGSAAMLQIGKLAGSDPAARDLLFGSLADPGLGPSAAAALAAMHDDTIAAVLGDRLRSGTSESSRRLHVLALKLDGSAAATEELRRFAKTRSGSAPLQKEVRQWLER